MAKWRYPPAYRRYQGKHPTISIRVTEEEKGKIDEMARLSGKSKASLVREALLGVVDSRVDELENAQNEGCEEGYDEGFKKARKKYEVWFYCSVCGKKITIFPNSESHKEMVGYMKEHGWHHASCE